MVIVSFTLLLPSYLLHQLVSTRITFDRICPKPGAAVCARAEEPRMEAHQKASVRRIRRNSETLLQSLFYRGVHGGGRDTPVRADPYQTGLSILVHFTHCFFLLKTDPSSAQRPANDPFHRQSDPSQKQTSPARESRHCGDIQGQQNLLQRAAILKLVMSHSPPRMWRLKYRKPNI